MVEETIAEETKRSRKLAIVPLGIEFFWDLIKPDEKYSIHHVYSDPNSMSINFVVECDEFPEVPEGTMLPRAIATIISGNGELILTKIELQDKKYGI